MRKRRLSIRQHMVLKFNRPVYCGCEHCTRCGCGMWERHHSDIKYTTPMVVRPFDAIRCHFEKTVDAIKSLWSLYA